MGKLPALDFCFYCRSHIPEETFPHVCPICLGIIQGGGSPITTMFQDQLMKIEDSP